jgi:O-antigen/teichoic acid export membrane protein
VFTNLLIARGYERLLLVLNGVGSALTLLLSLLAIPRAGFVGAAAATLIASVLSQAILLVVPSVREDAAAALRPVAVPTMVAVALSAGGIALGGPELVVASAAVTILAVVVAATGAVGAADWRLLLRAFGRA